ncbi:hypothetical protein ADL27_47120, partial [Streptomyces sp. NRRL F-6602]
VRVTASGWAGVSGSSAEAVAKATDATRQRVPRTAEHLVRTFTVASWRRRHGGEFTRLLGVELRAWGPSQ